MTNIMAGRVNEPNYVICGADTMVSQEGSKGDNTQKLFYLGPHIFMPTGDLYPAQAIFNYVQERLAGGPIEAVRDSVLTAARELDLVGKAQVHFIVAGPDKDKIPRIYQGDATGYVPPEHREHVEKTGQVIEPRYSECENSAFSGSGSGFIGQRFQVEHRDGLISTVSFQNVVEGLKSMYLLAKTGAADKGVNDKLQLALITPEKTHLLMPPGVEFSQSHGKLEYIARLINERIEPRELGWSRSDEDISTLLQATTAHEKCDKFYDAMIQSLREFGNIDIFAAAMAIGYMRGTVSEEVMKELRERVEIKRKAVEKGIKAWESRNWDHMKKFLRIMTQP